MMMGPTQNLRLTIAAIDLNEITVPNILTTANH